MKKSAFAKLLLTASFFALGSDSAFTMQMQPGLQPDKTIHVPELAMNQAQQEIINIRRALTAAVADASNPHKKAAEYALENIGVNLKSARAARDEYNRQVRIHSHMQQHNQQEIKKQTEELQKEKEDLQQQTQDLQRKLEEAEKKVHEGMSPEKMRQLAEMLLHGAKGYMDLLFLYPFMIGTAENDALVEKGLENTKREIENVEAQNKAYQEDRKKAAFSNALRMPEIDAQVDRSPLLNDLAAIIGAVATDLAVFKKVVIAQKADKTIAPLYIDLIESESTPTPTGRSYRYLERLLSEFMAIFSGHPPYDPLRVNKVFNKYKNDIPLLCKYIAGIEITGGELSKAQTKMLSNIKKSPLIRTEAEKLLKSVEDLSKVLNKIQPGGKFKVAEDTLNALAANELMRRLQGKSPQQFHEELVRNLEFFQRTEEEVGLESKVVEGFKKNAESKEKLLAEMWFIKNFNKDPLYSIVEKLRLAGPTKDSKENADYVDKKAIDKVIREKITQIIDGLLLKYEGNLQDPALKHEAQLAVADNFNADFSAVVDDLIDRKIKEQLRKEQDNPTLLITQAVYNAQCAHAQLMVSLQKLHHVVGDKLDKVDATHGPVEARALELRTLCQQYESALNYIDLDSDLRATHYVLVLGALASPQAWEKLGVHGIDSHPIIEALIETRKAYFAVVEAISKVEELVPITKVRSAHYWPGFEMNAKPLVIFDPTQSLGGHGGGQQMLPPIHPPINQPVPLPQGGGRGGPRGGVPQLGGPTPAQLMTKIAAKFKLSPKVYDEARKAFLEEIRNNWKKLDYAPTLDRFLEILRGLHNAEPHATQYGSLDEFKKYLNS